jgi:hypothetical protein
VLKRLLVQAEQAVDRAEHVLGVARGDGGAVLDAQPQRLAGDGQRLGMPALFLQQGSEAVQGQALAEWVVGSGERDESLAQLLLGGRAVAGQGERVAEVVAGMADAAQVAGALGGGHRGPLGGGEVAPAALPDQVRCGDPRQLPTVRAQVTLDRAGAGGDQRPHLLDLVRVVQDDQQASARDHGPVERRLGIEIGRNGSGADPERLKETAQRGGRVERLPARVEAAQVDVRLPVGEAGGGPLGTARVRTNRVLDR